jgi:hypothetical protein
MADEVGVEGGDEMGGACGMQGGEAKCIYGFDGEA